MTSVVQLLGPEVDKFGEWGRSSIADGRLFVNEIGSEIYTSFGNFMDQAAEKGATPEVDGAAADAAHGRRSGDGAGIPEAVARSAEQGGEDDAEEEEG